MIITDTRPHVLSNIKVDVAFQNLEQKIKTSDNSSQILGTAERALDKAKGLWKPMAVYQWFEFENTGRDNLGSIIQNSGSRLNFDFGYSSKFLMDTRHALVTVYTVGQELEEQVKLCSLLPLENINVKIRDDAVLSPFKTISCLIGLGSGYDAIQVGTTCQICARNHECQMKQN